MLPFFPAFIPNLLQVAPFVMAFALLCAKPLHKYAGCFYILWTIPILAVTWYDPVISFYGASSPAFALACEAWVGSLATTMPVLDAVVQLLTSSYTGVCLYLIVMFIGAMEKTPLVKRLLSVRSELSVIGGIIIMGHVIRIIDFPFLFFNPIWAGIWGNPAGDFMFIAAVIIGPLLTLTFVIPWVTSFKAIRNRMSHKTWKKMQKLAYPFMALMVGQGFFLALGHLMYGYPYTDTSTMVAFMSNPTGWLATFAQQVATAWMYLVLGVAYVVLRLRKRSRDRTKRETVLAAHATDQMAETLTPGKAPL